jgi:hypothetical protein
MDGNLTIQSIQAKRIEELEKEVEKYKALEKEIRETFTEVLTAIGIDPAKKMDMADVLGGISSLIRQLTFSKKKQAEFTEKFSKMKNLLTYIQQHGNS